jgi:cob(I)alamin adenosyltransferase
MPDRLTKIYTRRGDAGYTTFRDSSIPKDDFLIEAIGTIDELNSAIGLVVALHCKDKTVENALNAIQNDLFNLGGELHSPEHVAITAEKVSQLEQQLDEWNSTLPPLKEFLLPRGNQLSAASHLARTICRRAERCLVRLHRQTPLSNTEMLRYLNRLSDVLFVLSRILARETNEEEKMWEHQKK